MTKYKRHYKKKVVKQEGSIISACDSACDTNLFLYKTVPLRIIVKSIT